ncbi:hypothetical protein PEPNEM18_01589 [Aedoeadaptatus nemausensis]|uniref:Uncharacterized protein n=1 Tax=Aedoeadaptatus nemausensis TaxID=2582829 RepID=A0A6V6Y729_9FIRM|nr:hypothetical protein PEPNEM18_01589 [Peptoniphilus nemausensis]
MGLFCNSRIGCFGNLGVFYGKRSFLLSYNSSKFVAVFIRSVFPFALFEGRIFSNFNFKGNFFLNNFSSAALSTDSYNSVLTCFFCFTCFKLSGFLVVSCCNGYLAIYTRRYFFSFPGLKVFVVDIFCIKRFFYYFCRRFSTDFNNFISSGYFVRLACSRITIRLAIFYVLRVV